MIRKFMQCMAAALCCLPVVAIAASDDSKELERQLAKLRSEPMVFVVATGEPKRLRARLHRVDRWGGQIRSGCRPAIPGVLGRLGEARPADLL